MNKTQDVTTIQAIPNKYKRKFWRRRRIIESGGVYEICLRTRQGLPFQQFEFIKLLLLSSMARAQALTGVKICHFLWMGNHCHMIVIPGNQTNLSRFYGILQKACTDWLKALLGIKKLSIWDPRPSVIALLSPETVAKRIAYLYANPARAKIAGAIDHYRGANSYEAWRAASNIADYVEEIPAPRIGKLELPAITENSYISDCLEVKLTSLVSRCFLNESQTLRITPNAWASRFASPSAAIQLINDMALQKLKDEEHLARRVTSLKQHYNPRLTRMFFPPHIPKKFSRKVFVISDCAKMRSEFIRQHTKICELTHELYQTKFRYGLYVQWPAGIFVARPQIPACALRLI